MAADSPLELTSPRLSVTCQMNNIEPPEHLEMKPLLDSLQQQGKQVGEPQTAISSAAASQTRIFL
jgi:hypothetical protein